MARQRRTSPPGVPSKLTPSVRRALRADVGAGRIAHMWRSLTGGGRGRDQERRTLIACSGGADSAALVLALASHCHSLDALVVGHVVHDLRPKSHVEAECERVRKLAASCGVEFLRESVRVKGVMGNAEGVARERRYGALVAMAETSGCAFVATAHQGDDLLETVLMRLLRGSGVRGLVGIHESRPLGSSPQPTLIRPMLGVTRADTEQVCRIGRWTPNEDPTNRDTTRLRSRLRHDVLPVLRQIVPGVHERVLETSRVMAAVEDLLEEMVSDVRGTPAGNDTSASITRAKARAIPGVVMGEFLRESVRRSGGAMDHLPARAIAQACSVIQGPGTDPKVVRLPGLIIMVTAHEVTLRSSRGPAGTLTGTKRRK